MIDQLIGIIGGALSGGGIAWTAKTLIARRQAEAKEREAAASVERSAVIRDERVQLAHIHVEAAREERTEEKLWARLAAVEEETKLCEQRREQDRAEHERQRREDRAACDREIQQLRARADAELERVQGIALDALSLVRRLPSVTDSMSEEIDRIRARSTTPPRGEWRLEAGGSDTDPGPLFDDED